MAEFSDLLGRVTKIEGDAAKVREILKQMLSKPVAAPTIVNDQEKIQTEKTKKIQEDINKLSEDFAEYKKDAEKWVDEIIKSYENQNKKVTKKTQNKGVSEHGIQKAMKNALKTIFGKGGNEGGNKGTDRLGKSLQKQGSAFSTMERFAKSALKPGSIYTHDVRLERLVKNISRAIDDIKVHVGKRQGGGGGSRGGSFSFDGNDDAKQYWGEWEDEQNTSLTNQRKKFHRWGSQIGGIASMLLGGYTLGQVIGITDPETIKGEIKFMKNMRAIAFQTEGITSQTGELQKEWQKTGKVVAQTGHRVQVFQEQLVDNLKRGVRSRKDAIAITKTGLQLSTMIGSNARETADLFNEWTMTMDLSTNEMADLSRGIQDVARWTGVTGDRLMQAVKSAEQFMKRMRAAGNSTAVTAKNLIMMQATAQKIGIADEMKGLMEGMSNNADLLFKASDQTKALLFGAAARAGMMDQAINGTILNTRKGMEGIATGMADQFKSITNFDIKDIDNMPQDLKARMNLVFESAFGMGIQEFAKAQEVMREGAKGFSERLSDIDKELEQNLTSEERRALELKKIQLALSAGLEQSTKLAEVSKTTNSITEAVDALKKQAGPAWEDMTSDLMDLTEHMGMSDLTAGIKSGDQKSIAKAMGLSAAKALKEAGGEDYQKDLLKAIESDDMSKIREIQKQMNKEQQELGVDEAQSLDPLTESVKTLNLINESLRGIIAPILMGILGALGAGGILATMIGTTLTGSALIGPSSGIMGSLLGPLVHGKGEGTGVGFGGAVKNIGGAVKNVGKKAGGVFSGIGKVAMGGMGKITGKGASAAATAAMGTGGIGLAITAAIGGVIGAFEAGAKAADLFKVKQEELTVSQRMSAESAGFLTGALNFLTFGIFGKWLGPTGKITEALARFFEAFWPLNLIFQAILVPIKVLWGILKGLWKFIKQVFIGIWEGVKLAVEPIIIIFAEIRDAFSSIIGAFNIFDNQAGETIGIVDAISSAFKMLGTVVGWLFKAVGFLINIALKPLVFVVKIAVKIIKSIVSAIKPFFQAVGAFLGGLFDILKGIFTLDGEVLWNGIKSIFIKVPTLLLSGLKKVFIDFPLWLLSGLKAVFIDFPIWLGKSFLNGLKAVFIDFPIWLGGLIIDGLKSIFIDFPVWLWDTITGGIADIGTWLWDTITGALAQLGEWILDIIPGLRGAVKGFTETEEEFIKTKEKEGPSLSHGLGGVASIIKGDFGKSWEGVKEVASALNPLNWFDEGTREIQNTGVAVLHAGEMVIPKDIWEKVKAVGSGKFGSGAGTTDVFSDMFSMLNPLNMFPGINDLFSLSPINPFGTMPEKTIGKNNEDNNAGSNNIFSMLNPFNMIGGLFDSMFNSNDKLKEIMMLAEKQNKEDLSKINYTKIKLAEGMYMSDEAKEASSAIAYGKAESERIHQGMRSGLYENGYKSFSENAVNSAVDTKDALDRNMEATSEIQNTMSENIYNGMLHSTTSLFDSLFSGTRNAFSHILELQRQKASSVAESAEPAPISDVHDRVAQEQAGAEAGSVSLSSDELVQIAMASHEQVELLRRLVELQEQISGTFGGKESGLSNEQKRAMTRSMTKAVDTPQFYRWQYGQYGENASKDVVVMPS